MDGLTSPVRFTTLLCTSPPPVSLMPLMAEAATAKEVVDEETTCQSLPRLRASGPAGAPVSLPVPGATELLIRLSVSPERMHRSPPTETVIGQVHRSTACRDSL